MNEYFYARQSFGDNKVVNFNLRSFLSSASTETELHWRTLGSQRASAGLALTVWPAANEPRSCVSLHATPTPLWTVSRTLGTGAWEWPSRCDCSCMERYRPPARTVYEWMNEWSRIRGSLKHDINYILRKWIMKSCREQVLLPFLKLCFVYVTISTVFQEVGSIIGKVRIHILFFYSRY